MERTGEIITLNGGMYKFQLPKVPRETEIWYHDVPKAEQYWKTPFNKNFKWLDNSGNLRGVKRMPEKEKVEYINYWRDKWLNGLWIMVNGEPTWLSPLHVDHLIFNKFKNKNLWYLDAQRERFYFRTLTNEERLCDGRCWIKCRRAGITTEEITEAIRVTISDYYNNVFYQSDTFEKAKSTLLSPTIETYLKRPEWMREVHYTAGNGKTPVKELKLTSIKEQDEDELSPLGGRVRAFPSNPKSADGEESMLSVVDEFSKHEGVSPMETFEVNKKTIVNPGKRGKMDVLSTSGDSKDAAKATRDWHTLIAMSNPKILNANGKTNSGLWEYFVDATNSMELVEQIPDVLDKYGKVNREMAEEYIWTEINKFPKNSKEYIFALYKMPLEKRHAMLTANSNSYFSKVRISARLEELRAMPNDLKPYVRGNFKEDKHGKVFFKANDYGDWLIALHPYSSEEKGIDTSNRFRVIDGVFFPPINPEYDMGYDPIRQRKSQSVSNSLSDACIIIKKKWDYFGSGISNAWAALYLKRPDDPKTAHREAFKAAKYYGCPFQHERIIDSVLELAEEERMIPFLLKSEKDGKYGIWIDNQGKIVQNGVEMLQALCAAPKEKGDTDMIAECPFEAVLQDMDGFDMANTTEFDVMMAMIEMAYASKQNVFTLLSDQSQDRIQKLIDEIIPARN